MGGVVLLKLSSPPFFDSSSSINVERLVNNNLSQIYEKQYEKQKRITSLLAELDKKVWYI
jgi:hypothetical protein